MPTNIAVKGPEIKVRLAATVSMACLSRMEIQSASPPSRRAFFGRTRRCRVALRLSRRVIDWLKAFAMSTWFAKNLGDGITAAIPAAEIEKAFAHRAAKARNPPDMAVLTRYDSEGRLQCEVTAFFSPAAAEIARLFEAEPCGKPPREGLELAGRRPALLGHAVSRARQLTRDAARAPRQAETQP